MRGGGIPVTRLEHSVNDPQGGGNEEELIGDSLCTTSALDTVVAGLHRATYLITMDTALANRANDSMFVQKGHFHRWGWYTNKEPNCGPNTLHEVHDLNGDTLPESAAWEKHCLPSGEYALSLWHVTWNQWGSAIVQPKTLVRSRRVAMLDTLGSPVNVPSSHVYHDVRVAFQAGGAGALTYTGDIRAGTAYVFPMEYASQLYAPGTSFTINPGGTLWFISTYTVSGSPPRQWFGKPEATLTHFAFDYSRRPTVFSGAINSAPLVSMSPYRHVFTESQSYEVVGKVVSPADNGHDRLESAIWVSTVGLRACYAIGGALYVDSVLTFDGNCSAGPGPLEYRWTFGDGSPAVEWSADSVLVHHAYHASGPFTARLQVRVQGTQTEDDSTTALTILVPIATLIRGVNYVSGSGTYFWRAWPSGGTAPYHYQWYYQRAGEGEYQVGADSVAYGQWVGVEASEYHFTLRVVVTDGAFGSGQATCHVQVGGYPNRPLMPPVCD